MSRIDRATSLQTRGADFGDGSLYVTYRNVSSPTPECGGPLTDRILQQVILSIMGIPGALLAGWMVERRYLGRKGTLAVSTGTLHSTSTLTLNIQSLYPTYPPCASPHRCVLVRKHDRTHVGCIAWLELWLHIHEQRHVRHAVRALARDIPLQGQGHGKRARRRCESRVWRHGESRPSPPCLLWDKIRGMRGRG